MKAYNTNQKTFTDELRANWRSENKNHRRKVKSRGDKKSYRTKAKVELRKEVDDN